MFVFHFHQQRGDHSIVKLNTTCEQKQSTSWIKHNFIMIFSWVDIYGIYYIVKNNNQISWYLYLFYKTYRFKLEWRKIELKQLLQKWR